MRPSDQPSSPRIIPYARQSIDDADIQAVVDSLRSDFVTQGPRVEWFEDGLREATGAAYAVAVSSGTAALHLACLGLGVGPEDVGIVPAITFAATANCLGYVGAEVRFCDVDPKSGHARAKNFSDALALAKGRAKVLFPVSYGGQPCEMEAIAALGESNGVFVIEDAAHSIGAMYTRSCGSARSASCAHSDAAILSFHPVKHVCAGEGGAVMTNDATLARRLRSLRSHGIDRTFVDGKPDRWLYEQKELGFHYRMTEMQAALGWSQLAKLDRFIEKRRVLAERYLALLSDKTFDDFLDLPMDHSGSSWHLFVVRFKSAAQRVNAYDYLHANGVRVQVHYIPVYRHPFHQGEEDLGLPGAEAFYSCCLSLPLYPDLSFDEQDYVIGLLRALAAK